MLPEAIGPVAQEVDSLYWFIFWQSIFWFIVITAGTLWFTFKYHQKGNIELTSGVSHSNVLEITWTVIPTISIFFIFIWSFRLYMKFYTEPVGEEEYTITVKGEKWKWTFFYPNGASSQELVIPENRNIKFVMTSKDVIHSLFLVNYRAKMDVIPGRYTVLRIPAAEAPRGGSGYLMDVYCTEYCGTAHSRMTTFARLVKEDEFEHFLEHISGPESDPMKIYTSKGCNQCHSIDGVDGTGPSWKGLAERFKGYKDNADAKGFTKDMTYEAYITQSIRDPAAVAAPKAAGGSWALGMNRYTEKDIKDGEILKLAEWIKNDFKTKDKDKK